MEENCYYYYYMVYVNKSMLTTVEAALGIKHKLYVFSLAADTQVDLPGREAQKTKHTNSFNSP